MKADAQIVSRVLRRGGMLPVSSRRDGIQVRRAVTGGALVVASVAGDSKREAKLIGQAGEILTLAGYSINRLCVREHHSNILHVTEGKATK
jgi:hypothetical protein